MKICVSILNVVCDIGLTSNRHNLMDDDEAPWWMSKGDFQPPEGYGLIHDVNQSDSEVGSSECCEKEGATAMPEFEKRSAQFTNYSISSSMVPRNDGMFCLRYSQMSLSP